MHKCHVGQKASRVIVPFLRFVQCRAVDNTDASGVDLGMPTGDFGLLDARVRGLDALLLAASSWGQPWRARYIGIWHFEPGKWVKLSSEQSSRCLLKHGMQPVGILGETTRSPLVRNVKGIEHSARDVASRVPAAVSGYGLQSTLRGVHRESSVVLRAVDSDLLPAQNATGSEVGDSENLVWGEDFEERFCLGEVIGHGQQGLVRKVVRRETGDVYAAKVLSREASVGLMRDTDEKKMRSEANFLHKLQGCPVVARMEGAYFDDQHVYIVMERLDGGNIADNLDQGGCFAEKESAELMREVLGFLAHSHELGIFYGECFPIPLLGMGKLPLISISSLHTRWQAEKY